MENKIVLITGAAKRIGKEIAIAMAENSWNIALHYNSSKAEAEQTLKHIKSIGVNACVIKADLTSEKQLSSIMPQVHKKLGRVSCLINNASVFQNDNIANVSAESWHKNMAVNLYAPTILSQEFAKQLPDKTQGNIINMLDYTVLRYPENFLSYTASKSGLWTLTQQLALALAPNIRVNAIGPGIALPNKKESVARIKKSLSASPLKMHTSPAEICNAIQFILSAQSMTGQMLALDGGKHLLGPEVY